MKIFDLAIIGAGPAGIMAAIAASQEVFKQTDQAASVDSKATKSNQKSSTPKSNPIVAIFDSNSKLARKLLLTGKGRCNFTNDCPIEDLIAAFNKNGKFLYPAFYNFSNQDLRDFFTQRGLKSKVERGGRVFPITNQAGDIIEVLKKELKKLKVKQFFNHQLTKISIQKDGFRLLFANQKFFFTKKIIITTGGKTYPQTGSTGDGYRFAEQFAHQIIKPRATLSALYTKDEFVLDLAGLSLKNVELSFFAEDVNTNNKNNKPFFKIFGEMLFTHKGISGPIVLTASKYVGEQLDQGYQVRAEINFKPALNDVQLRARLDRELIQFYQKELKTLLKELLPKSLIPIFIAQAGIDPHLQNAKLSQQDIQTILFYFRHFPLIIKQLAHFEQAIVTTGGVALNEVDPSTMASKLEPNLYFAGEVLDLDAPTGGYNLQMAFSTGYLAGKAAIFTKLQNKTN